MRGGRGWNEKSEVQKFGGFVKKAMHEPCLMAHCLALWCQRYGRSFCDVANELGCSIEIVIHVAMCGAPRPNHHNEDIIQVAEKFAVNPITLAALVYLLEPHYPSIAGEYPENVHAEQRPPFYPPTKAPK